MVKGIVKTNKANDTKYIYLSKDCGFNDGQEVDIKFSGIGIYNEQNLKKYVEENKEMFKQIKERMNNIRKEIWTDKFFKYGEILSKYLEYGKLEWDDEFYFEKNNEYSASPDGDIDGGELCDFNFRIEDFDKRMKERKLNKVQVKKEIIDFLSINFLKGKSEAFFEEQHRKEVEMMEEFGLENKESSSFIGEATTLYSNGIVQVWYDAEGFSYDNIIKITTMSEVGWGDKEPTIEF